MIEFVSFSYELGKHEIHYHLHFKTPINYFITEFQTRKDCHYVNIDSEVKCKIEILDKYWQNFCERKLYNSIYTDKEHLYINVDDNKCFERISKNQLKADIIIDKSILCYSCRAKIYLVIPYNIFAKPNTNILNKNPTIKKTKELMTWL